MKHIHQSMIVLGTLLMSPLAQAHDNSLATGLLAGLSHPLTGLDHLAALILAGVLIGRLFSAKHLAVGGLLCALGLGAAGGLVLGSQAGMESIILLSLPAFLALQWVRGPGQLNVTAILTSLFMVAHGWAHGVEIGAMDYAFIPGFLLTSAIVMSLSCRVSAALSPRLETAARSHLA